MSLPRTFDNAMPGFIKLFTPLIAIPGLSIILIGLFDPSTKSYVPLLGVVLVVAGPFLMIMIDRSSRPRSVTLQVNGVMLSLQNKKEILIPWDQMEIMSAPTTAPFPYKGRGNIRPKGKRSYYTISGEISSAIKNELVHRSHLQH
jgi:hypothetical protein